MLIVENRVTEQPFKIPFVATIVRVANAENAEAGKAVLDHMVEALQSYVNQGLFQQVKLMLRFFACLGDVLGELGIASLLDEMIVKLESYKKEGDEVSGL
jgi:nuclear cap-binding protein subunit 1